MKNIPIADISKLSVSLLSCLGAGVIGSFFTTPAIPTWYAALQKPAFNPPNWLFAPVWTALYLLMGIAVFLVWRQGLHNTLAKIALGFFGGQLFLNVCWSLLFFGLRSPLLGLAEICLLWVMIVLTLRAFLKVSLPAGLLLLPYLAWVSFAAFLNWTIWRLNS
jgi:translocator protein